MVTTGRQAGERRHVASGHEADGGVSGKRKETLQPVPSDFFDDGRAGRHDSEASILIPGGREESAPSAAGCVPPMTKPKKRPDPMSVRPGQPSQQADQ